MKMNMKRLVGSLSALGLAGQVSCVSDRDGYLVVQQMQPLDEACQYSTDEETLLTSGILDLAVGRSYLLFPRVENNIQDVTVVQQFQETDARINTKDVTITRARIAFTTQDEISAEIPNRDVRLSGTVPTAGSAILPLEVLTPTDLATLRAADQFLVIGADGVRPARASVDLTVNVQFFGETADGNEVESNNFDFSLRVCNGCLISFPFDCADGAVPDAAATEAEAGGFCANLPGQDRSFNCAQCNAFAVDPIARQLCIQAR
jgi:hypothetical protein